MEKEYNKLVRDNIPKIIEKDKEIPIIRFLSNEEYRKELYKKLLEECNEVLEAQNSEERIEELSDVLEIIKSIAELEGQSLEKVLETANNKRLKKGGFQKRIFLEKTILKTQNDKK